MENIIRKKITRRKFISNVSATGAGFVLLPKLSHPSPARAIDDMEAQIITVNLTVNGAPQKAAVDTRVTLLDLLREKLALHGSKKGCDHGQCGACTVLVDERRVNACLMLAAMCENASVTTIEGLAKGDDLHPMQQAFIKYDAFQCGYCTPGQICSAIGLIKEGHAKTDEDIQELMSGNICRCGAYRNILAAVKQVQSA